MWYNSVRLFLIWASGSGDVIYRSFLSRALAALSFIERNHTCNLIEGIMRNNFVKLF